MKKIFFLFIYIINLLYQEIETKNIIIFNDVCEKIKDFERHLDCYLDVEDESLLDIEPIDVVIKYIDLTDTKLNRKGIPQIKKDIDNGELRFSVRSILKNIPWVNKIFIVMPNEKVKFFKDNEEIKEKIIYIKDKDLAGFDSASCTVFEFRLWKLKKFGMSDNFIYLNDDCFIGNPLKKSDFFYVENGRVVPYVFSFHKNFTKQNIEKYYNISYHRVSKRKHLKQDNLEYQLQMNTSRLFIYKLFGDSAIIEQNIHNAIPDNVYEGEEIYNVVLNNYEKPDACFNVLFRALDQLVYQEFRVNYIRNKYNRKRRNISSKYFDIQKKIERYDLFVVNKGDEYYNDFIIRRSLIYMNEIFPIPSKYEKIENIPNRFYLIETELKENMVLNFGYDYSQNKNTIYLNKRYDRYSEFFFIEYQKDNSYIIKSIYNTYLEVSDTLDSKKYSLSFNKNIEGDRQKWYILLTKDNYYFIVSKDNSKCCIDVTDKNPKNNLKIQCYYPNGKENQMFKFIPVISK